MSNSLMAWIHDDITWCAEESCPIINCVRNQKNMMDRTGLHSFAMFRETNECPIYRMERDADIERNENKQ